MARDRVATDELVGVLGQRLHHGDHVNNLKSTLLAVLDRFLTRDHHHRHAAQLSIGSRGHKVRCTRAQRRHADAGLTGQATIGRRHESRSLFVPSQNQLDR